MKVINKIREFFEVQTYPELEASAQRQRQIGTNVIVAAGLFK